MGQALHMEKNIAVPARSHRQISKCKLQDIKTAMSKSGAEVIKCAAFVCGLMVQKEDSLIKDIASDSNYVRRLQDERTYKLLEHFVRDYLM
jgi:hypothetical protein